MWVKKIKGVCRGCKKIKISEKEQTKGISQFLEVGMTEFRLDAQGLRKGCVLASIAYAVSAGEHAEMEGEHSWDRLNYCINNFAGIRGTITFHPEYIVAVFREESKADIYKNAYDYFAGATTNILKIAEIETLRYMLQDVDGEQKPVITAAFWGTWSDFYSTQSWNEILENGGSIIENYFLGYNEVMEQCKNKYGLKNKQMELIADLFRRKTSGMEWEIRLKDDEIKCLRGDLKKTKKALRELNIFFDIPKQKKQTVKWPVWEWADKTGKKEK